MGRDFSNTISRVIYWRSISACKQTISASPSGLFLHKDIITEYMKDKRLHIEKYSAHAISVEELESLIYIGGGGVRIRGSKEIYVFILLKGTDLSRRKKAFKTEAEKAYGDPARFL